VTAKIPSPIDRLVAAINAGDTQAFLGFFGKDGVVEDWGRRFKGPAAIRRWSDKELIGAKGRLTVTSASHAGNTVTLTGDWKSSYFSGASRMIFTLDGDHVREMKIPEAEEK
jgi:ketosteroid isomerase-like protein